MTPQVVHVERMNGWPTALEARVDEAGGVRVSWSDGHEAAANELAQVLAAEAASEALQGHEFNGFLYRCTAFLAMRDRYELKGGCEDRGVGMTGGALYCVTLTFKARP